MKIEITVLSEASQKEKRQIPYDITPMWNLKYDTNELIYETETHSQTQRADLWWPKGRWDGRESQFWDRKGLHQLIPIKTCNQGIQEKLCKQMLRTMNNCFTSENSKAK